jgi:hypothetical protein
MMYYSAPILDMRPSTINIYSFRPAIRGHLGQPDGASKSHDILHISKFELIEEGRQNGVGKVKEE